MRRGSNNANRSNNNSVYKRRERQTESQYLNFKLNDKHTGSNKTGRPQNNNNNNKTGWHCDRQTNRVFTTMSTRSRCLKLPFLNMSPVLISCRATHENVIAWGVSSAGTDVGLWAFYILKTTPTPQNPPPPYHTQPPPPPPHFFLKKRFDSNKSLKEKKRKKKRPKFTYLCTWRALCFTSLKAQQTGYTYRKDARHHTSCPRCTCSGNSCRTAACPALPPWTLP